MGGNTFTLGSQAPKEAMRQQLLEMRCVPWCGLLSSAAYPVIGAFPCTAPTLWPERLSADCSWSPWRSKWNHMGEPDSGTWPEEKLTWAVRQAAPSLWDGWWLPLGLTLKHTHSNSQTQYHHTHTVCMYAKMACLNRRFSLVYTPHPSYILSGVFCGCSALRSGQPIRSIYRRASRHANNTKHTNGRETKPQATDIQ